MSDKWADAWNKLTSALEQAFEAGLTDDEIEDCIENARPEELDTT